MPLLKKVPTLGRILRISAAALVIFFCVAVQSHAQQTQIDSLAAKVASAIHKSFKKATGQQLVMVVISEPVIGPTELGATIANQFRSTLAARGISLVSSTKLQQTENEEEISPAALRDRGTLACVASFAGATVIVDGTLQRSGDSLNLATAVLRAKNAKVFFRDNVDFDRTPELAELQKKLLPRPPISRASDRPTSDMPEAGKNGYTHPTCLHCPIPRYTGPAFSMREQGTVVLDVVIAPDGKAHSVTILRGLSCGLNLQAVRAAENWTFKPANGPDGKAATVHMLMEMDFHLY
ncbi:MAG: energy transducer TonB [Candidatus Acidiferrales bacterium]